MANGSRIRQVEEARKKRREDRETIREALGRLDRTVAVEILLIQVAELLENIAESAQHLVSQQAARR